MEIDLSQTKVTVSPKEKDLNDWLPVTSSRNGKWWYSAFHNVTAMVGAGVLGLPYAMSELGWGAGAAIMILSWVITLYTLWQMIEMHEMVPSKGISLAAAIMSFSYSTIAWVASARRGFQPEVSYAPSASTSTGRVFQFFSALGDVAFAFAGHNVVLEIQATIPSTPEKPSKKPMWKGVLIAYIVVAMCYIPVAFVGYATFGRNVEDNILISLEKPAWLIAAANLFVVIHVIGSYQVFAMPVFDMVESCLVRKMNFKPTRRLSLTMFLGMTLPFFGGLLGFLGGFAFAPTTYYICIILGFLLMILAPIGALRQLVLDALDFDFYS
ncbi:unnamed protein product [Fraxinus pennsylvanica]|uniref:Amino acid transporter transmembrane domain-containing protein n=1 Tax=Fraxinus pennsylvanica TaxID=56036 RepID=A0AAD2DKI8_9LAMI|nr:unnamed protein product [Fraxinus pennsylvanica]